MTNPPSTGNNLLGTFDAQPGYPSSIPNISANGDEI